ncbi:MAG: hypothetical protein A3K18_00520 [Lentisphaerae bacterium RIFOXYA12_64_32]|nr:MAG: hypothetical protein A3K18_00520 [Lentisphaerae bacterium RIFOXYA12_64_32]
MVVVAGAAAVVLLFGLLFWWRAQMPRPAPAPPTPPAPVANRAPVPAPPAQPAVVTKAAPVPAAVPAPAAAKTEAPQAAAPDDPRDPAWEFTEADIATAGRGAKVDLGDYQVAVGQEFSFEVGLTAPPLANLMLIMTYDPELLEVLPDSAKAQGNAFRRGIEFYADPKTGRMALISAGLPGQKNMLAAEGAVVASVRLRARKAGETRIGFIDRGISLTNARLEDEPCEVTGGRIVVK